MRLIVLELTADLKLINSIIITKSGRKSLASMAVIHFVYSHCCTLLRYEPIVPNVNLYALNFTFTKYIQCLKFLWYISLSFHNNKMFHLLKHSINLPCSTSAVGGVPSGEVSFKLHEKFVKRTIIIKLTKQTCEMFYFFLLSFLNRKKKKVRQKTQNKTELLSKVFAFNDWITSLL